MSKPQSQIEALARLFNEIGRFIIHCGLGDIEVLPRARAEKICETYRKQVFDVVTAMTEARRAVAAAGVAIKPEWCARDPLPLTRVELYDRETAAIRRQKVDYTWAVAAQLDINATIDNLAAGAGAAPKRKRGRPAATWGPREDRIVAAWHSGVFATFAMCAAELGEGFTESEVRAVVRRMADQKRAESKNPVKQI